jgi:hypothetical protein
MMYSPETRAKLPDLLAVGRTVEHGRDPSVVLLDGSRDVPLPAVAHYEHVGRGPVANGRGCLLAHQTIGVVLALAAVGVVADEMVRGVAVWHVPNGHL